MCLIRENVLGHCYFWHFDCRIGLVSTDLLVYPSRGYHCWVLPSPAKPPHVGYSSKPFFSPAQGSLEWIGHSFAGRVRDGHLSWQREPHCKIKEVWRLCCIWATGKWQAGVWTAEKWGMRIQQSIAITSVKLLCRLPRLLWGLKEIMHVKQLCPLEGRLVNVNYHEIVQGWLDLYQERDSRKLKYLWISLEFTFSKAFKNEEF